MKITKKRRMKELMVNSMVQPKVRVRMLYIIFKNNFLIKKINKQMRVLEIKKETVKIRMVKKVQNFLKNFL